MKTSKQTLSIGIPAHNEDQNILCLLQSIYKQDRVFYNLEKIYVLCDGCTDATASIVEKFAKTHPKVILINDFRHIGKAQRLNEIYDLVTSELLLTLDADVVLPRPTEIDILVSKMIENPPALVVGPRYIPVETHTLMGKFAEYSYMSFEEAILQLNNGINMYALMGAASLIRKKLYKSFTYPKGTISDQNYLFAKAIQFDENAFLLAKEARVLFYTVTTFHDWRVLSSRSVVGDKVDVVHHFGEEILRLYTMPRDLYVCALWKWMKINPLYTSGAVLMNILIRVLPYNTDVSQDGIWEIATSSKQKIAI